MAVQTATGTDAFSLLDDAVFRRGWERLQNDCFWATAFQRFDFANAWYYAYRERFDPVIIFERDNICELTGLLALAVQKRSGGLVVAGDHQAEYQVWLDRAGVDDAFIEGALAQCRRRFPGRTLSFQYLPPGAPTGWTEPGRPWSSLCSKTIQGLRS